MVWLEVNVVFLGVFMNLIGLVQYLQSMPLKRNLPWLLGVFGVFYRWGINQAHVDYHSQFFLCSDVALF